MSDVDFNAILDTPVEEIKSRPPLPGGLYDFRIKKADPVKSGVKKTDGIKFTVVPYAAVEVDEELLAEAGGFDREMALNFWITAESQGIIRDFLVEHCGLEGSGRTLRQLIADSINSTFRGLVENKLSNNNRMYADIKSTMRIE